MAVGTSLMVDGQVGAVASWQHKVSHERNHVPGGVMCPLPAFMSDFVC